MSAWPAPVQLKLSIRPSVRLATFYVLVHLSAVFALLVGGLSLSMKLSVTFAIAVALANSLNRYVLLKDGSAVCGLESPREGSDVWQLNLTSGKVIEARAGSRLLVTQLVIVILFSWADRRRYPVALFCDSVGAEAHRQARVLLRQL